MRIFRLLVFHFLYKVPYIITALSLSLSDRFFNSKNTVYTLICSQFMSLRVRYAEKMKIKKRISLSCDFIKQQT